MSKSNLVVFSVRRFDSETWVFNPVTPASERQGLYIAGFAHSIKAIRESIGKYLSGVGFRLDIESD